MDAWIPTLLHWLALPEFGLSTVFVIALISATLLPMGSEPAVVGLLQLRPDLFWPAILVATAGNTLGGMISWWLGRMAHQAWQATHPAAAAKAAAMHPQRSRHKQLAHAWLVRWGAKPACSVGCRLWATLCVPWPGGCACRFGLAAGTWRSANSCAMC